METRNFALLSVEQGLPTSGARAALTFELDCRVHLAVPQLAEDIPGQPADMNGGDSDIAMPLFCWENGGFRLRQTLPLSGGEDAEFFHIGERAFLATASIRSGAGPYELNVQSVVHEWDGTRFVPFQSVPTFAAKQWRHFAIGDRHFLALAQGVRVEGLTPKHPSASAIFEWDGARFAPFQEITSGWGYNFRHFRVDESDYLAYADHVEPSVVMRWTRDAFETVKTMDGTAGRAFEFFEEEGEAYLAYADLVGDSLLYRWDGSDFALHQRLDGPGGREFATFRHDGDRYLVRVNFLTGTPQAPKTDLTSTIYRLRNGALEAVGSFPTLGATDVSIFEEDGATFLAVSESLSADIRFRTDTHIYRFGNPTGASDQE